jgi:hypothetical protein
VHIINYNESQLFGYPPEEQHQHLEKQLLILQNQSRLLHQLPFKLKKAKPKSKRRMLSLKQFLDIIASKDWSSRENVFLALTCTLNVIYHDGEDTCDSIVMHSLLLASFTDIDSFSMDLAKNNGVLDTNLTVAVSALEAV